MGTIQGKGFSQSVINPFGESSKIHSANCFSRIVIEPFSESSKIHSANCLSQIVITPLGHLSKLILWSISAISSTKIRIVFDRAMLKDLRLTDYLNYTITPVASSGVSLYFTIIETENKEKPTFIDIITSEMTNGETYQCIIDSTIDGPSDTEGTPIDISNNTKTFTGIGAKPEIVSVAAISQNRVDITFSEILEDNSAIRDKNNYSFDKGLSVLNVLDVDGNTVKLVTSDQDEGELYTLTIAN